LFASNVVVKIPVPRNTSKTNHSVSSGKAKYEPDQEAIMWRVRRFPGDTEYAFRANVMLSQTNSKKGWGKPPISMDF